MVFYCLLTKFQFKKAAQVAQQSTANIYVLVACEQPNLTDNRREPNPPSQWSLGNPTKTIQTGTIFVGSWWASANTSVVVKEGHRLLRRGQQCLLCLQPFQVTIYIYFVSGRGKDNLLCKSDLAFNSTRSDAPRKGYRHVIMNSADFLSLSARFSRKLIFRFMATSLARHSSPLFKLITLLFIFKWWPSLPYSFNGRDVVYYFLTQHCQLKRSNFPPLVFHFSYRPTDGRKPQGI